MDIKRIAVALGVAAGVAVLSGCVSPWTRPMTGPIVSAAHSSWGVAPDITFRDQDGRLRSLSSFYADATVVVFLRQPCTKQEAPLALGARSLRGRVAVVEICTPPGGCKDHHECVMRRGDKAKHLISLCDGTGIVRQWFGVSTEGAVFVLDLFGSIVARGSVADLDRLAAKAEAMAQEAEAQRMQVY